MNKKFLVIPVLLLTFVFISIPVMAAPAKKIEGVTMTRITPAVRKVHPGYPRYVGNGIGHSKGNSTFTVRLTIPGLGPMGSDLILEGARHGEWISNSMWKNAPDPDPEARAVITASVVITFTGTGTTGTFVGRVYRTITGFPFPSEITVMYTRIVLHGTGDFRGQTVKLIDGEGYAIIPK
jgi:hypothetical protein